MTAIIRPFIHFALTVLLLGVPLSGSAAGTVGTAEKLSVAEMSTLQNVVKRGQEQLIASKRTLPDGDEYWVMPAYLGAHYVSQYYLLSLWLGRTPPDLDETQLLHNILSTQNRDGSWLALPDANLTSATTIDPSLYHYWALKVLRKKFPRQDAEIAASLSLARAYIVKQGGIDSSILFTKIILAMFGNYSWDQIPSVPLSIFQPGLDRLTVRKFSQWVIPHLKPIAYMRSRRLTKDLGPEFRLDELRADASRKTLNPLKMPDWGALESHVRDSGRLLSSLAENVLMKEQHPRGSWGGYTLSTLFTIASLQDYARLKPELNPRIEGLTTKGFDFVETLYFKTGSSSYRGVLDDCSYWDTALSIRALRESGYDVSEVLRAARFLQKQQRQEDGSFPFGYDFWSYPDVDDTVEIAIALDGIPEFAGAVRRAYEFIASFQNKDNGWGTFDRDNTGNSLLRLLTRSIGDSADLFDESAGDMTGHALELLGRFGHTVQNSRMVRKAVSYLKRARDPLTKSWESRWEVNHIFGTHAVIAGLRAVGMPASDPLIRDAAKWLISIQNQSDGGFGESTESYRDRSFIGRGVSTASQTSWAILALIDAGYGNSKAVHDGVRFLINQMARDGHWSDPGVTGTGHPGLIYMVYPSYPMTWPLMALGRYLNEEIKDL